MTPSPLAPDGDFYDYCAKCCAEIAADDIYCGRCGAEVDARGVPSCPICGTSVWNEDTFCRMCGARLCACDAHGRRS